MEELTFKRRNIVKELIEKESMAICYPNGKSLYWLALLVLAWDGLFFFQKPVYTATCLCLGR
jgi:hypothetical protein